MNFEFATSRRVVFGCGKIDQVGKIASGLGNNALVITGARHPDPEVIFRELKKSDIAWHQYKISGEPTVNIVNEVVEIGRERQCNVVIGFGGGSVIDTGKAVSALLTNPGSPMTYLEVVGEGNPLVNMPVPFIAIPTTSGTGSEVTRNAVLTVESKSVKVSLRSPMMLPAVAIVDPELTYSQPPALTASVGMDAFTQVLEPFVSVRANPMVDLFCKEGLIRASRSLKEAYQTGAKDARIDVAWASLLGGMALANAGLGAVHGFAGPIGGMFNAPHGTVCAALLPVVTEVNIAALMERMPDHEAIERYQTVARIVTGDDFAKPRHLVEWLKELCTQLLIPKLREFGVTVDDISVVVEKAAKASSMKGNPVLLTPAEMTSIIEQAL